MQFLTLDQFPDGQPDAEFKEASWDKLLVGLVSGGICVGAILAASGVIPSGKLPVGLYYVLAAVGALFTLIPLSNFRRTLHPANWLVRVTGDRLWIKFRSYLNDYFPSDEVQIVLLRRAELVSVRPLKVRISTQSMGSPRETTTTWIKYLEIELAPCDLQPLRDTLRRENQHPAVGGRVVKGRALDFPVSIEGDRVIRVRWSSANGRVTPRLGRAIEFFSRWIEVRPAASEKIDYSPGALAGLPDGEQLSRLRQLAVSDPLAAVTATCKLRHCSIAEAEAFLATL